MVSKFIFLKDPGGRAVCMALLIEARRLDGESDRVVRDDKIFSEKPLIKSISWCSIAVLQGCPVKRIGSDLTDWSIAIVYLVFL